MSQEPQRPAPGEYAEFYAGYVALVPEGDPMAVLAQQRDQMAALAELLPEEMETYRYAPGKWTIRQVVGHLVDAERVFGHRAFCFSRGERAELPGFDENVYVEAAGYEQVPLEELLAEWHALRETNLAFLQRLDDTAWGRGGVANGTPITVRALAYVLAGHLRHHFGVLRDRYLR